MIVAAGGMSVEEIESSVDMAALYEEIRETTTDLLLEQAPADHRIKVKPGEGIGSLLAVPLLARDELLGALFVTEEVIQGFGHDDVDAIGVFAAQAALVKHPGAAAGRTRQVELQRSRHHAFLVARQRIHRLCRRFAESWRSYRPLPCCRFFSRAVRPHGRR